MVKTGFERNRKSILYIFISLISRFIVHRCIREYIVDNIRRDWLPPAPSLFLGSFGTTYEEGCSALYMEQIPPRPQNHWLSHMGFSSQSKIFSVEDHRYQFESNHHAFHRLRLYLRTHIQAWMSLKWVDDLIDQRNLQMPGTALSLIMVNIFSNAPCRHMFHLN